MKIAVLMQGRWTTEQTRKIGLAVAELNTILANPKFWDEVANLDPIKYFSGTSTKPLQVATKGLDDKAHVISVAVWYVPWYKRYTSAIAYESNGKVNIRSTYLQNGSTRSLAATLFHEWTHSIGYKHDFWSTKARPFSVPYALGTLVSNFKE